MYLFRVRLSREGWWVAVFSALGCCCLWGSQGRLGIPALPTAWWCQPWGASQWVNQRVAWAQKQEKSKRSHPTGKNVFSFEERCCLQPDITTVRLQKPKREELFLYTLLHYYGCLQEKARHGLKSNKAKQIFGATSWNSARVGWRIVFTNPKPRGWTACAPWPREVQETEGNWK